METTKKAKLISTIVVLVFIAIMIPSALFANNNGSVGIKNDVSFNVQDIEGRFAYAITGNNSSSYDVGTKETDGITPSLLFYSATETNADEEEVLVLKDSNGDTLPNETFEVATPGIHLDKQHLAVDMYFVFANSAENITATDNRTINITIEDYNTQLAHYNMSTNWNYIIQTSTSPNVEATSFDFASISNWQVLNNSTTIAVEPKNGENYRIAILKCQVTLTLDAEQETPDFEDVEISFNINLSKAD